MDAMSLGTGSSGTGCALGKIIKHCVSDMRTVQYLEQDRLTKSFTPHNHWLPGTVAHNKHIIHGLRTEHTTIAPKQAHRQPQVTEQRAAHHAAPSSPPGIVSCWSACAPHLAPG